MADLNIDVFEANYSEQGVENASGLVAEASNIRIGTNPDYTIADFLSVYPKFALPDANGTISIADATITEGNQTIEVLNTDALEVGDFVSGAGIPNYSYITEITDSTHFVIYNAATSDAISFAYYTPITPISMMQMYIEFASNCIKKARWHKSWKIGMSLFVAHFLTIYLQSYTSTSAAQVIAAGKARGLTTSKSAGDVSVGYDYSSIGNDLNGWAAWKLTVYGQQFATIAKLMGKGGMYVW